MKKILTVLAVLIFLPSVSFADTYSFSRNLNFGMRNDSDVKALQQFLTNQHLYAGPISGNFFSLTQAAIKAFQLKNSIVPVSGYVGPKTRAVLNGLPALSSAPNSSIGSNVTSVAQQQANKTQLQQLSQTSTNRQIIAKVKPAVVYIEVPLSSSSSNLGSGMILSSDGYILTNAHVVHGANAATITLSDGTQYQAQVAGRDENIDLAILKISAQNLSTVTLGDSDQVQQGDNAFAFGYPFGIGGDVSFTPGAISRRTTLGGNQYFQISNEIHHGNSGGPLVDDIGNVIGVNSAASTGANVDQTGALKYAIPSNVAKTSIPQLENGRSIVVNTPVATTPTQPAATPSQTNQSPQIIILPILSITPKPSVPDPTISNVRVDSVTTINAIIRWSVASVAIDTKLEYGTDALLSGAQTVGTGFDGVYVTGLSPSTTYYFRVRAKNSLGKEDYSDIQSFQTISLPTPPPLPPPPPLPVISNVSAKSVMQGTTPTAWESISFSIDQNNAGGVLLYGTDSNLVSPSSVGFGPGRSSPKLDAGPLKPATTYYFRIAANNPSGNSDIQSFTTPPLTIYDMQIVKISNNSAEVDWSINASPVTGKLLYSNDAAMGSPSTVNGQGVTTQGAVLNGLTASTTYYYQITATDSYGNQASSPAQNFTTLAQ